MMMHAARCTQMFRCQVSRSMVNAEASHMMTGVSKIHGSHCIATGRQA
jgi:hypothetical protein